MTRSAHVLALVGMLLLSGFVAHQAAAQQTVEKHLGRPARVMDIVTDSVFEVGHPVSFRARLVQGTSDPVSFFWDFGDGGTGLGNHIMYHYRQPGTYNVTVKVHNAYGRHQQSIQLVVRPRRTPALPASTTIIGGEEAGRADGEGAHEEAGPADTAGVVQQPATSPHPQRTAPGGVWQAAPFRMSPKQGYTWVVATHLDRPAAEADLYRLWEAGFLAGIVTDAKSRGSLAYRVVIGEFVTPDAALRSRASLPQSEGAWLLELNTH